MITSLQHSLVRNLLLLIFSQLMLSGCGSPPGDTVTRRIPIVPYAGYIAPYDTQDTVRIFFPGIKDITPSGNLLIATVNNTRVALFHVEDSVLYCYHKSQGVWALTDSFVTELPPSVDICTTDLNGDGYKDIRLGFPVMRGNMMCMVLLYYPQEHCFRHNHFYDLINVGYDTATRLVRSAALGGIWDNRKELYKISGDSLIFYRSVAMEVTADNTGTITWSKEIDGKAVVTATKREVGIRVVNDFDTCLWRNGLDYVSWDCFE